MHNITISYVMSVNLIIVNWLCTSIYLMERWNCIENWL